MYTKEPLIISFKDGVSLLKEKGFQQEELQDISTENEKNLGDIIKEKYGVDLFILNKYPSNARPFYTMIDQEDINYTNSFDIIFRGKEISSGAQRVNSYDMLIERIKEKGIDQNSLGKYVESFRHGSIPHGGCGFGVERLVSYYLDLKSVKNTSFCYRDPETLEP